jgi:hypothetical protein
MDEKPTHTLSDKKDSVIAKHAQTHLSHSIGTQLRITSFTKGLANTEWGTCEQEYRGVSAGKIY